MVLILRDSELINGDEIMKFKCLIELLKEKEYIEYRDIYAKGIIVGHEIKSDYAEVKKKIIEEKPDEYIAYNYNNLYLTTIKALEEFIDILYEDDDEDMKCRNQHELFIRSNRTEIPKRLMMCALQQSTRYRFLRATEAGIVCLNVATRDKELYERKRKEKEVREFLNSLP